MRHKPKAQSKIGGAELRQPIDMKRFCSEPAQCGHTRGVGFSKAPRQCGQRLVSRILGDMRQLDSFRGQGFVAQSERRRFVAET